MPTDEEITRIEQDFCDRFTAYLEAMKVTLDPDAGTETGDPAEYLANQIFAILQIATEPKDN